MHEAEGAQRLGGAVRRVREVRESLPREEKPKPKYRAILECYCACLQRQLLVRGRCSLVLCKMA